MAKPSSSLNYCDRSCALCYRPIRKNDRVNQHHPTLKSEGGEETVEVHEQCHVGHHSQLNHYREWGRRGGRQTAARGWWIFNLKRGASPPDPLRWIPFGYGQ